jgi:nicotinate-nucleotide adenylyltransferase
VVPSPPTVSEKRDLWMPLLLACVGAVLLLAHLLAAEGAGRPVVGAAAFGGSVVGALACLALRVKAGQRRMVTFGLGVLLLLVPAVPGAFPFPHGVLPWWIAGLALLRPFEEASEQARKAMLLGALTCVLLGLLAWRGALPENLTWLLLAAAFHLGVHVLAARPAPVVEAPVGPRVAIFGGTFDPFHRGHRAILDAAVKAADRVLVVVAGSPPHKQGASERTAFHHRVAMTRLGVEGLPRTEVLELEGRRQGPSYTIDTLEALARSYPAGTRFLLVLGADSFQEFPTWRSWEAILERATLLVAPRPGHEIDVPPEFEGRNHPWEQLAQAQEDVSSSALRATLADDGDVGDLLPPAIRAYVRDHRLYQPGGAGQGPVELADPAPRPGV